ncbi:C-terminal novel E3 ligase, LRR-interacting [Pseudomonas syringae]|uniref:NEL-type E3 ubiquitin ligase domain-containing protein n=1 Tax=Pseudomonas syringae TaxID=317 RepID=UPI00089BA6F7|nr:NEL-type E3 ubiquitin ligase domain-containing protein [Pseudomonas syringae]SDX07512.1 C-terminal novel E3 ligase, LRR-interacting [Pseudomonas syringae]SFM25124.1 C-terminal novel E3 ligase, LRR-interacting [Pseudomonas syringae]
MSTATPPLETHAASTAQQFDSAPFEADHPNAGFIRSTLPAWYLNAPATLRQALHVSQQKTMRSWHVLEPIRNRLLPPQAFAAPLLSQAFFERFKLSLDVEAFQLMTWRYDSAWKPAPLEQTLLQAALQNFAASNRSRFDPYSAILRTGGLRYWLIDSAERRYSVEYKDRLAISPEQFADFCHDLDLGARYQTHLDSVFKPSPADAAKTVAAAFIDSERDAFEVIAHIAMMKGDITDAAYQVLLNTVKPTDPLRWDGNRLRYCQLHMLDTYAFSGCLLHGALLIQQDIPDPDSGPCIVYLPSEPFHPLKQYASLRAFNASLVEALGSDSYRRYFSRFVSLSQSPGFFASLKSRLYPGQQPALDVNADLLLQAQPFSKPPFELLYEHLLTKTYADSRAIAVPAAQVDQQARDALLESLENNGMNMLNVAGLFVPVLGEVMAVVALYQLASEAFVAYEDWTHGEVQEAMQHIYDIGENVAQMLVMGSVMGAVGRLEPSMFIESLVQMRVDGSVRLGKPTINAFADNVSLPDGLTVNALGLYEFDGKTWLPLDGKLYRVEADAARANWRIRHPVDERSYSPRLKHNGAGIWHHEWENPMGWDEVTAFRRLSPTCNAFTEEDIQKVMRITGTTEGVLRQIHVESFQPPALLQDAIQRMGIERELQGCIEALKAEDLSEVSVAHIEPWLKLLASSPRWSKARGLLLVDAEGTMLNAWNVGSEMTLSSHVVGPTGNLTQALGRLLEDLTPDEISLLTGSGSTDKTAQVRGFKRYLADYAQRHVEQLLDGFHALENRSSDPLVKLIQRDFGRLPDSVALELLSMTSDADKAWMASEKRIPLELAEHVREYQQQLRINRAIEGFYRSSTDNPDTHAAGLGVLQYVPGWRGDVSIDLLKGTLEGDEIASLESAQAHAVHRILVRTAEGFQLFNPLGDPLGETDQRFFSALLNALTDQARIDIELPLNADEQQLRSLSGRIAATRRDRVADILRMQPIKPGIKWPQRLPDGRTGYPLSGRLRRFFRRLGIGASSHSPELAVKSLYPDFTDEEVSGFLGALRAEHTGSAGQLQSFVRQRLRGLADELRNLQTTLDTWVEETPFSPLRRAREVAARRIHDCWKRLSVHCRNYQGEFLGYALDLDNLRVGQMPDIAANFGHVAVLKARNMRITHSQADALLKNFNSLRSLSLDFNNLQSMPESIGRMTRLAELSLSHNPLNWTDASNAILQNLTRLEILDLNFCSLGPDARIAALNSLRLLFLRSTGIETLPEWNWLRSDLIRLDVRDNRISEISNGELANIDRSLSSSRFHLHLNGNPLSAQTLARIRLFREGRLRSRWGVGPNRQPLPVGPDSTPWLAGLSPEQVDARTRVWQDLRACAGSTDFFQILSDLTHSADFSNNREELTARVWAMIASASANRELRLQLFDLAAHPQTCGDGLALVFGDMEIRVSVFSIMSSAPESAQPLALFKMSRSLDRLDQVEKIAQRDIALRHEMRDPVDEAEVRLAYRIGLQAGLELPGQPRTMLFSNMARVTDADLEAAYTEIIAREGTREFFESLVAREFWMSYLEIRYAPDFEPVKMPFTKRLAELDELSPNEQSDQQYLDRIALISKERGQAVNDFAISLSMQISAAINTAPQ